MTKNIFLVKYTIDNLTKILTLVNYVYVYWTKTYGLV